MITIEQLKEMFELQNSLNEKINPDWENAGYKWTDAIMAESVEAIDHYGWKWWKKQEPNLDQVKLELVDIFHFIISQLVQTKPIIDIDLRCESVLHHMEIFNPNLHATLSFNDTMKKIISDSANGIFDYQTFNFFQVAMHKVGLTWDELYIQYIAKNVLNIFRQDHGYKLGTYIKVWNGVEDNEVLVNIINNFKITNKDFSFASIYDALEVQYIYKTCMYFR